MVGTTCRSLVAGAVIVVLFGTAGCSDSPTHEDLRPLPTSSASGELDCHFLSHESLATMLGTKDFHAAGDVIDHKGGAGARTNPDGSTLTEASCSARTDHEVLKVLVEPLGLISNHDAAIPEILASGRAEFTYPAAEGLGFAGSRKAGLVGDGVSELIVGDWRYSVVIVDSVEGRDAVQDAVAITRQIVATLGLPKVGTKPRPTAAPSK